MTLYERIGGPAAVTAAVELFYARVWADPRLAPAFVGVDRPRLKAHQRALLEQILDGRPQYRGNDLAAAHAGLDLTNADFDRTLAHLVDALSDLEIDRGDIAAVAARVEVHRAAVVSAP